MTETARIIFHPNEDGSVSIHPRKILYRLGGDNFSLKHRVLGVRPGVRVDCRDIISSFGEVNCALSF